MKRMFIISISVLALLFTFACSQRQNSVSYRDSVKNALEQADFKSVTVDEDGNKNTITLGGRLHSEDAKLQAAQLAQASAGNRIIVNQISVEPVGNASEARKIEANVDDGIENNYKAALAARGLDKE